MIKRSVSSLVLAMLCLGGCDEDEETTGRSTAGRVVWVRNIDDADTQALSVATDAAGNTFVAVVFYGAATVGQHSFGTADAYSLVLAKYATTGSLLFLKTFEGDFNEATAAQVVTDKDNAVVLLLHNPGGVITLDEERAGATLAKLSGADGTPLYSVSLEAEDELRAPRSVGVDSDGDVLVVGTTHVLVDEEPGPLQMFFTKLRGQDGLVRFTELYGHAEGTVEGAHLAVTTTGDAIVSGRFTGRFALDEQTDAQVSGTSYFIARLSDDDGAVLWTLPLHGPADAPALPVATGPADEVVVLGELSFPADPSDDALQPGSLSLVKLDATEAGALLWRQDLLASASLTLWPGAVAVDAKGAVLMTASYRGRLSLGDVSSNSVDRTAVVVAKYSGNKGQLAWARAAEGAGNARPLGLAVDGSEHVVASGILSKVGAGDTVTRELFVMRLMLY